MAGQGHQQSHLDLSQLSHMEGEPTASQPPTLDVLQEWVTGPAMWAVKGMEVVETIWEMKETHWGWAKAKQMAEPSLQVAKKPQ